MDQTELGSIPAEGKRLHGMIRPLTLEDISKVVEIEEASFPTPWKAESFRSELVDNYLARYFGLELDGLMIGYMGLWNVMGEGHITNIAVSPAYRGQGWGEYLLKTVMETLKRTEHMSRVTLEVRVSNYTAQKLYTKLGFRPAGFRRKYYTDNREDALIMWASL
ncbi:(SSU ribosomal protein S18P)-alanine acetyltransferase [Syntrophobotulus glycolicus DSM 8271]|uniref:(SSU ribosomal protein S18P)-alanine acetyltransferase n=1 Tax=Syntrophobotulus glycolicus (strain DSM 8271 / FlGlyR) TaxID=645991 RepID=F0SXA3_SYNGF|nr:ribosomal protein S18-alanine N-acetyltransferase [Syntrophobotulus glycolicus]ADY56963.1 (SSU ribosomal protein S18P)-alanine acetyltransferase [Syntrophobotulus glycolicus DSM 8271]